MKGRKNEAKKLHRLTEHTRERIYTIEKMFVVYLSFLSPLSMYLLKLKKKNWGNSKKLFFNNRQTVKLSIFFIIFFSFSSHPSYILLFAFRFYARYISLYLY